MCDRSILFDNKSIHPSVINCNQFTLNRKAYEKCLIAPFSSTTIHAQTVWYIFFHFKGKLYESFRIMNILKAALFLNKNDYYMEYCVLNVGSSFDLHVHTCRIFFLKTSKNSYIKMFMFQDKRTINEYICYFYIFVLFIGMPFIQSIRCM